MLQQLPCGIRAPMTPSGHAQFYFGEDQRTRKGEVGVNTSCPQHCHGSHAEADPGLAERWEQSAVSCMG
jgi:hypothetical protein